jgi:hypothetical protein
MAKRRGHLPPLSLWMDAVPPFGPTLRQAEKPASHHALLPSAPLLLSAGFSARDRQAPRQTDARKLAPYRVCSRVALQKPKPAVAGTAAFIGGIVLTNSL